MRHPLPFFSLRVEKNFSLDIVLSFEICYNHIIEWNKTDIPLGKDERMDFITLRQQYPTFTYHGYVIETSADALHITYHFSIEGLCDFHPTWRIPCTPPAEPKADAALQRLVFSLGMTELVSYWKITCSPMVRIRCGWLSPEQQDWWKRLYFGGLGEFFYRNGIATDFGTFMQISCTGAPLDDTPTQKPLAGKLIPIGGGKDSIVTLGLLHDQLGDASAFLINHRPSAVQAAQLAGIPDARICEVSRTLDPNMLRCNQQGFLNGHTPFSAIVAFGAVLTAYLRGIGTVILSNESSASEATVALSEQEINHQYSKSYAFEQDFFQYERDFLRVGVRYFSLLRPLTEFQIARYFAAMPTAYHEIFRSCNVGAKQDAWCGHCAKCLFVSVILSPFLPHAEIVRLLGADLLNDAEMEPVLQELCGARPNKPFECVGSRREVNIALCLAIARAERAGESLPQLLTAYRGSSLYAEYAPIASAFGQEWDANHHLPPVLAELVREMCVTRYA